jgi:hypothetical protein
MRTQSPRTSSPLRACILRRAFFVSTIWLAALFVPGVTYAQSFLSSFTGINGPTFVAIDANRAIGGTTATWLYVSEHGDTNNNGGGRILRFNLTSGSATPTVVAPRGTADGQFIAPDAILVDSATGDLIISDRAQNRIQRITNTGTLVMKWGSATAGAPDEMHGPLGLARDSSGAIYITEHGEVGSLAGGNFISKYTLSGTTATRVWRNAGTFQTPYGIAVSGTSLFISDGFGAQIQIWNTSGSATGAFPLSGIIPTGLFLDSSGALWISESSSNGTGSIQQVEKRSTTGAALGVTFGTAGTGNGQFMLPFDVAIDSTANRAYVADYSNNRVQVFDLAASAPPPPTSGTAVSSFALGASTATSIAYQLTFSQPVTGVTSNAFTVATTGGATATIGAVAGSGTTYTIPVTFSGTTGTIQLSLKSGSVGITDASGTAFTAGASGPTFTIPSTTGGGTSGGGTGGTSAGTHVVTVTPPANGTYSSGQSLTFTVAFSGNVTVAAANSQAGKDDDEEMDEDSAPFIAWTAAGAVGKDADAGIASYVSGSGTSTLTFTYRVKKDDNAPSGLTLSTAIQLPTGTVIADSAKKALDATALKLPWAQNPLAGVILAPTNPGKPSPAETIQIHIGPGLVVGEAITLPAKTESGAVITWVLVSGNATLNGNILTPKNKGTIVLRAAVNGATMPVTSTGGSTGTTSTASSNVTFDAKETHNDRLINLSSRLTVGSNDTNRIVFAGFVVNGTSPKQILVRAVGPSLAAFGISQPLANPHLMIRDSKNTVVADNNGWNNSSAVSSASDLVGAFKLSNSHDAAVIVTLAPGAYTAQVSADGSNSTQSGITLVEVYDATTGTAIAANQLINISTRGMVDIGQGQLVAGFVVSGDTPKRVLVRGVGPSLAAFGVSGTVADPVLKIFANGSTTPLAENDDWQSPETANDASGADIAAAATATGAFPLANHSKDAALLLTLAPGNYSAVMSGARNTTGAGLIEIYEVPYP